MHGADTPPGEGQYTPHQTYIQAHQDQTNEDHSQGTWIQIWSPVQLKIGIVFCTTITDNNYFVETRGDIGDDFSLFGGS